MVSAILTEIDKVITLVFRGDLGKNGGYDQRAYIVKPHGLEGPKPNMKSLTLPVYS